MWLCVYRTDLALLMTSTDAVLSLFMPNCPKRFEAKRVLGANMTGKVILFLHQLIRPKLQEYFKSLSVQCVTETHIIILVM